MTTINNPSQKGLKELFSEALDMRNLNVNKLADLTDIPERFLIAIKEGDFKKLPAAPYVHGYFIKIGQTIGVDGEALWQAYRREGTIKISGDEDRLPTNRYAIKSFNKRNLIIVIVVILVLAYGFWRFNNLLGTPKIDIVNPILDSYITKDRIITLSGTVDSQNDKVSINSEEVLVDTNGHFEKDFSLNVGLNVIEFKAKKLLGKEIKVVRQIIYQP